MVGFLNSYGLARLGLALGVANKLTGAVFRVPVLKSTVLNLLFLCSQRSLFVCLCLLNLCLDALEGSLLLGVVLLYELIGIFLDIFFK